MGIYAGIDKARANQGGRYLTEGDYLLEVRELKNFESQQTKGRWYFAADLIVHSHTNVPEGEVAYQPGDIAGWLVDLGQQSALSNITGFAMALKEGATDEDITEEVMEDLTSAKQPATGIKVRATAFKVKTRKGTDFTKINWSVAE